MPADSPDPPTLREPDSDVGSDPGPDVGDHTRIVSLAAYSFGDVIGSGGMGEVVIARDARIGRDVALKRMKTTQPTAAEAQGFLREARIQARLDHPAIVPVYEMGRDVDGRMYFTMKRVTGSTLSQQISAEPPASHRLLRAFADVCMAVELAHTRGVAHRDLKPANIMLGELGEVYVIDWGLARVVSQPSAIDLGDLGATDETSRLLGTPGYTAPEQLVAGAPVGRAADVYALGAILFELLVRAPLHPREAQAAIDATLSPRAPLAPSVRFPDSHLPPELDALCVAALAADPAQRPTARTLAENVRAYLDGDRDLARRKAVATEELWRARTAHGEGRRADAMREAGRALALDPESTGAAQLVTSLMLEPPREAPPELAAALRESEVAATRRHALTSVFAYTAMASFLPLAAWNGVRKWPIVLAVAGVALVLAAFALAIRRRPQRSFGEMLAYAAGNAVLLALISRVAGPFTFVPALTCVVTMSSITYPAFVARPVVLIAMMLAGFLVPISLESAGWLERTWELRDGGLLSHAGAIEIAGTPTVALVIAASLATMIIAGIHAASMARVNRRAQQQLVSQAWHLRQLLPR